MDLGEKTIVTKSCELLLDAFQFVGSMQHNIFIAIITFVLQVTIQIVQDRDKWLVLVTAAINEYIFP
jgi:hypothetical protein